MDRENIKKSIQEIEKIYQEYVKKVNALKKEQDQILKEFLQELEKAKIKEIRDRLKK